MTPAAAALPHRARAGLSGVRALLLRDTNLVIATVVATNLLRMVSSVVLTRLLMPEAFGIVGLIGSISFILSMLSDLGFQAFVVRHRDGDQARFLDVIWTIRLVRAIALTILLVALARPIAAGFGNPGVAGAIAVSALQFAIEGASSLSLVTALRERQLARLSLLDILGALVQFGASIALASVWRSYWSIVLAILLASLARTLLSYALFPRSTRRIGFDRGYATELWRFARYVTGSSIITMLLVQSDKVVLARVVPLDVLGRYMLAGNLALAPMAFTVAYASRVLYPLYARTWRERPEALRDLSYAARMRVSAAYMVGVGGLIGFAPALVAILYDPRYAEVATYLRLLALTPFLALASHAANEVLTASGRVHVTMHANVAKLLWLAVAGTAALLAAGPIGLIAAVGLLELPTTLYNWMQLHRFGLLRLGREVALLALGVAGIAAGSVAGQGVQAIAGWR